MPRIPAILPRSTTVAFFGFLSILGACGDGGTGPSDLPAGEPFVLQSIDPGNRHTCGLTPAGKAYCWGNNEYGQLGDGTATDRSIPVAVAGGLTFRTLQAGGLHSCGIAPEGETWCWGYNGGGRLGDGSTVDHPVPVKVVGGAQLVSLSIGGGYSCGLAAAGAAYCWGPNYDGNFGNEREVVEGVCAGSDWLYCTSPVPAAYGLELRALAVGSFHACGLAVEGKVYCWGSNLAGVFGDGTTTDRLSPTPVGSNRSFVDLSGRAFYTCALRDDGEGNWDCWGHLPSDFLARHYVGSVMGATLPAPLAPGLEFRSVSVGNQVACGITNDDVTYCWGDHLHGAIGDGRMRDPLNFNDQPSMTPRRVLGEHAFRTVVAGLWGACGLTAEDGIAYCWGYNQWGQLGDGTMVDRAEPVMVRPPS